MANLDRDVLAGNSRRKRRGSSLVIAVTTIVLVIILVVLSWMYWPSIKETARNWWDEVVSWVQTPAPETQPAVSIPAPSPVADAQPAKARDTYKMKKGDELFQVFGVKKGQQVCDLNKKLGKIQNCNKIREGKVLDLPDGVKPLAQASKKAKAKPQGQGAVAKAAPKAKKVLVTKKPEEQSCIKLGASPYNKYGKMELRLQGIDELTSLTSQQKEKAKALVQMGRPAPQLIGEQVFKEMLSKNKKTGKTIHIYNKKVCNPTNEGGVPEVMYVYELGQDSDGNIVYLADPERCGNISVFVLPPPKREEPPPPVVEEPPPAEPPVEPPQVVIPPVVAAPPPPGCRMDGDLTAGFEHEPGTHTKSLFATWDVLCMIRGEGGWNGYGVGGINTRADGKVSESGKWKSSLDLAGPAYKRINDEGTDWTLKGLFGTYKGSFEQGDYESSRRFGVAGIGADYNDYRRKLRGEKNWNKFQYFATAVVPTSRSARHSWQGQPIADTSELTDVDSLVNVGMRAWATNNIYLQGGLFAENPNVFSGSLRVGIADDNHIVGCHVGPDKDLKGNGGWEAAYGCWVDAMGVVKYSRTQSRLAASEETGGFLMVPVSSDTPTQASSEAQLE